jgi:PAS domain S-box-containing protein
MSAVEFHRLLDELPAAAYTVDAAGLIDYYNDRALELWGRAPRLNDPADRYCGSFHLFRPDGTAIDHDQCWMARALRERRSFNGEEIVIERPDGARCTVLAHANPIFGDDGALLGAVNVLIDITDRKHAETLVREADRAKRRFLAVLAHELRNPLAPLRNALQVLRVLRDDRRAADAAIDIMERQLLQLVRLIDDLLALARINNGKFALQAADVDVRSVLVDAVETSRPHVDNAHVGFTVAMPAEPVRLHADRVRLAQAIAYLLNNAAAFTRPGGKIWLSAERDHDRDGVVIRVRDTGSGMQARAMSTAMLDSEADSDPTDALGVALSLVRELIGLHGGSIEAHSVESDHGSEFVVRLPALPRAPGDEAPAAAGGTMAPSVPATPRYRILVADDNRDAADSMVMMLTAMGHEARAGYDGLEAVALAATFKPDVAVLDLGMPGLDGFQACRHIRALPGGERVMLAALTGWGREDDKRRSLAAGFDRHLTKPVEPAMLERLLADVAEGRQTPAASRETA